ncbi:hypothetical protein E4U42_002065, partial [Claviceps africana]
MAPDSRDDVKFETDVATSRLARPGLIEFGAKSRGVRPTQTAEIVSRPRPGRNVLQFARLVHVRRRSRSRSDNSIPFEWDHDAPFDEVDGGGSGGGSGGVAADKPSTITPSEADIFKSIFDEIAQGRMPSAKKRPATSETTPRAASEPSSSQAATTGMARSIVEQARVMEFRDKFLRRYPASLRTAAQVALGLYEQEPTPGSDEQSKMVELDEADKAKWEERARFERLRTEERERVDGLMGACDTDAALWRVMEAEVFSLPARLGILPLPKTQAKARNRTSAPAP